MKLMMATSDGLSKKDALMILDRCPWKSADLDDLTEGNKSKTKIFYQYSIVYIHSSSLTPKGFGRLLWLMSRLEQNYQMYL